jgi:hypothetical protein
MKFCDSSGLTVAMWFSDPFPKSELRHIVSRGPGREGIGRSTAIRRGIDENGEWTAAWHRTDKQRLSRRSFCENYMFGARTKKRKDAVLPDEELSLKLVRFMRIREWRYFVVFALHALISGTGAFLRYLSTARRKRRFVKSTPNGIFDHRIDPFSMNHNRWEKSSRQSRSGASTRESCASRRRSLSLPA